MKKLFLLSLLFLISFALPHVVEAKSFYFPKVEIDAQINSDSSVELTEARTFEFDGSFTQIYWDIPLTSGQTIKNIHIEEQGFGPYEEIPFVDPSRPTYKFAAER